jgi:hypothetical protein
MMRARRLLILAFSALSAQPATAQGLGLGLPSPLGEVPPLTSEAPFLDGADGVVGRVGGLALDPAEGALRAADLPADTLTSLRRRIVDDLLRRHRRLVDADEAGQPVVRGEVLAIAPSRAALAAAQAAGFRIGRRSDLASLDLAAVVLIAPRGVATTEAAARLRRLDPDGAYELNHLYQASGETRRGGRASPPPGPGATPRGRLGLIDGSVSAGRPAFRGQSLTQRAFGPGGARVTDHATAVASLMIGSDVKFRGAAPGAALFVADVYGPTAAGGSAEAIAGGLAWLAENRVETVNISLVGPPNRLLQAAVERFCARRRTVVAAVGNDGPAAPPLYPAAYPEVVAVTGVDGAKRILPEAGRGAHMDFAAPGSDMAGAGAKGGYLSVRGTSFAAPLVAAEIATRGIEAVTREAEDLGAPGPDPAYGRGLVAFGLRTAPASVGARKPLRGR